jgi:hypothetical protein
MLRAMRVVSEGHWAGVAFPDERLHRVEMGKVSVAVERLGVVVFWVAADGAVAVDSPPGFGV